MSFYKKSVLILMASQFFIVESVCSQIPVTNPYASRYLTNGHWTDSLKWNNIVNAQEVTDLIGENGIVDSVTLQNVIVELHETGGGVLFFPAGNYYFDYDIVLFSGVILRGEAYGIDNNAHSNDFRPPTKFNFPKYNPSFEGYGTDNNTAFKKITKTSGSLRNSGLVDIDLNRARIDVYAANRDLFHENIIIFGVRQNNVAVPDAKVPSRSQKDKGHGWQRWPAGHIENMVISAKGQCVIANCRLNDAITDNFDQLNYLTDDGDLFQNDTVSFNYLYHRGISLLQADENQNFSEIVDNYIVTSRYFDKINTNGTRVIKNNNKLIHSEEEKEFHLLWFGLYSHRIVNKATNMFEQRTMTMKTSNVKLNYQILEPKNFDPNKKYPLVLFYHGIREWEEGSNRLINFVTLFADDLNYEKFPCFVVVPHGLQNDSWNSSLSAPMTESTEASISLIKHFVNKKFIDKNRVYATGISDGAQVVWEIMLRYPKLFASAVPIAGYQDLKVDQLKKIKHIPVWLSAGAADELLPIQFVRLMKNRITEAGIEIKYNEYEEVGHRSWLPLYFDQEFLPWMFSKTRRTFIF